MRRLFPLLFAVLLVLSVSADDSIPPRPSIFDDMPGVQVRQDSAVQTLLHTMVDGTSAVTEIDGYRVQIYSSNRQQTAKAEALQLEKEVSDRVAYPVYVLYMTPFWKVRIGNFRTFAEANAFKAQFVSQYPDRQGDTYVVRDKIQVVQ